MTHEIADTRGSLFNSLEVRQDSIATIDKPVSHERTWRRTVIVSNRLPYDFKNRQANIGGMSLAMMQVLEAHTARTQDFGMWIGWDGDTTGILPELMGEIEKEGFEEAVRGASEEMRCEFITISLTNRQRMGHYNGYANEVLWPLCHGMVDMAQEHYADTENWHIFDEVNDIFAQTTLKSTNPEDMIWVQDYHLPLVAKKMRALGSKQNINFFLHTPFPTPEDLATLPQRQDILDGLLHYDLLGFQTITNVENFMLSVKTFVPDATGEQTPDGIVITYQNRRVRVHAFPISINPDIFAEMAQQPQALAYSEELRQELGTDRQIILDVSRLDHSKALVEGAKAYRLARLRYPEVRETALMQIAVNSRMEIPAYRQLYTQLHTELDAIQEESGSSRPVIYRSEKGFGQKELVSWYNVADILRAGSRADGMCLTPKEYIAVRKPETAGVVMVGEKIGAAYELLPHAVGINPYDIDGYAERIRDTVTMPHKERVARLTMMRQILYHHTISHWSQANLWMVQQIWDAGTF